MGEKISQQTEDTNPTYDDILLMVDDPAGTPVDKKVSLQSLVNTLEVSEQTGVTYTLALSDRAKLIQMNNASANTLTIPTNASVGFAVGTCILIQQTGAGVTTISGDTGVIVQGGGVSVSAGSCAVNFRYSLVTLLKIDTDTWVAQGEIGTIS